MKAHWALRVLAFVVSVAALLVGSLLAHEATLLGPLATPERIATYRFGSEGMIAHGGVAYSSRANYVLLATIPALLLLTSSGVGMVGTLRANKVLCSLSLLCAIIAAVIIFGV